MSMDKISNLNREQEILKSIIMDNKGFKKTSDNHIKVQQSSVYNPTTTNKSIKDKQSEISFHSIPNINSDDSGKKFCTILCK